LAVNLADEESSSLAAILRGSNWQVRNARTCREAVEFSHNGPVPVVLCQPNMPDGSWNTLMDRMRESADPPAVVVVSRLADERLWAEVLSLGGYDVLMTPFDRAEVLRVLFLAWMASKRGGTRAGQREIGIRCHMALRRERVLTPEPGEKCASGKAGHIFGTASQRVSNGVDLVPWRRGRRR